VLFLTNDNCITTLYFVDFHYIKTPIIFYYNSVQLPVFATT